LIFTRIANKKNIKGALGTIIVKGTLLKSKRIKVKHIHGNCRESIKAHGGCREIQKGITKAWSYKT
jgi:hypothetical protein